MGNGVFNRSCAICGEDNTNSFRIWFDGYQKLYKCLKCGFVAHYPGPGCSTIIADYEETFYKAKTDNGGAFNPKRRQGLQDIVDRVNRIKPNGKILDIGCGDGHFLHLANNKGLDCYGVESSKALAEYASSHTSLPIFQEKYSNDMFPENSFDIITLIQVVEHLVDPLDILRTAKYHLRSTGIIVVEVPSIHAPHFLLYQLTRIKWLVRPPHGVIDTHVGYYSPKTLITLMQDSGFMKLSLVTGRWQYKYHGFWKILGKLIDPILNLLGIGGILYIGSKE